MTSLGIDIGSSSVKAAVLRDGRIVGKMARAAFETRYDGVRAEVDPDAVLEAVAGAIDDLGAAARRSAVIGLSVMSPAWVAMDERGRPITPIVTHQDRRSLEIARELEKRVGKANHLRLAGNRPFPGSISSTTLAWFFREDPSFAKQLDLAGHLNTFLLRQLTGARAIDPSNASFTGLYQTTTQGGWSDELCEAVGVKRAQLPDVLEADQVAGHVTQAAAGRFGLTEGTPVMTGLIDTSAAMLLAKPSLGQLLNVAGSTDVLAVCNDQAKPHNALLTRALGVGRWWMSVATIAAAGSSFAWARQQLFRDLSDDAFWQLVKQSGESRDTGGVTFEPYLAGERASIEQRRGAFTNLTLATTREQMLAALVDALARASAARLPLLESRVKHLSHDVVVSGGVQDGLGDVLYRDWPGQWTFRPEPDATLRGLGTLTPRAR